MATEVVGLRRLFHPRGIRLNAKEEVRCTSAAGANTEISLYIGTKSTMPVSLSTAERYIVPAEGGNLGTMSFGDSALAESPHISLFVELIATQTIEIDDTLATRFREKDANAQQKVMTLAEEAKPRLSTVLDVGAGFLGLRVHRQLVLIPLCENTFAGRGEYQLMTHAGDASEVLESLALSEHASRVMCGLLACLKDANDDLMSRAANVLGWLSRAWREHDNLSQFIALFTPLEAALQGVDMPTQTDTLQSIQRVTELLEAMGDEEIPRLTRALAKLSERAGPSLVHRFRVLADKANLPGKEHDIEAFSKFNAMRNALLHRAARTATGRVQITEANVRTLEDLAERYICYALFGDAQVYRSPWRPNISDGLSK